VVRGVARGKQFPGRRITAGGRRKVPTMSQVFSSIHRICFRKTSGSNTGAPNVLLPRCYLFSLRPWVWWVLQQVISLYLTQSRVIGGYQIGYVTIGLFTWRFKWAHQLTFLVTWRDYCWMTNWLSHRMSSRESEHSTLVVAWFVSELPGKRVFVKQPP